MADDRLSISLQENLLLVSCFDERYGLVVRNLVPADLFEGEYRRVIARVYDYIDHQKQVPGTHVPDLFDDILEGKDDKKAKLYAKILQDLIENQGGLNGEYVVGRAEKFIRQQSLKDGILRAAEILQTTGDLDGAEDTLRQSMDKRVSLFDPGTRLLDFDRSLAFLTQEEEAFWLGIPELDDRNLGPARKELHLYIGLPKSGKTWWFVNMGKRSLIDRRKVVHITLEMSEPKMSQRYYQALFGMSKREEEYLINEFQRDELGRLMGFKDFTLKPKLFLSDPEIANKLRTKTTEAGLRLNNLIIKQFPTGQLTVRELVSYLDMLELQQGYIPDLVILDYADLMYVNPANFRHELGTIYKDLRGVAVERNIAVATASQSNRAGAGSKKIDNSNVAEDWSKIFTADSVITYNQTEAEHALGLARLFVAAGRNDADKFSILLSQNYATGQYVLDSIPMLSNYWDILNQETGND